MADELSGKSIEFVSQEVDLVFVVSAGVSSGTMYHGALFDRELDDQHPISSITGLLEALAAKSPVGHLHNDLAPTVHTHLKDDVGLQYVDNTADIDKPTSIDTQDKLNLKANASSISNIDNTSDANKPVSTAQQAALDLKLDVSAYVDSFSISTVTSLSISAVTPVFEEITRVSVSDASVGIYFSEMFGNITCDTVGRSVLLRWSLDGAATWSDPITIDIYDATEKIQFAIKEAINVTQVSNVIILQVANAASGITTTINKASVTLEMKS